MAWTLCSREDVIQIHPCQESELPDQWSEQVEALIRQHMRMPYLGVSQAINNEMHSGDGTSVLLARKPPIISVSSLLVNGLSLTANDYVVFESFVQLKTGNFPKDRLNITFSYTSGQTVIPPQVRLCAASMIVAMLNYYRRMGSDSSFRYATPDRQIGEDSASRNVGLTSHLVAIMRRLLPRSLKFK